MIIITGRIPSKKNSRNIFCRGKFPVNLPNQKYQEWHVDATKQITGQKPITSDTLTLKFFAPDKRKTDLTNKAESIMDLLVDNGLLEDDNWFVVNKLSLVFGGVDKNNPRVEIIF